MQYIVIMEARKFHFFLFFIIVPEDVKNALAVDNSS